MRQNKKGWAINSEVECYLHTVEVAGSNPASPTIFVILGEEGKVGGLVFYQANQVTQNL